MLLKVCFQLIENCIVTPKERKNNRTSPFLYMGIPVNSSRILRMWVKDSSAAETSLARLFLTFLSYSSTS